ncbi:hypothetical protein KAR91_32420 [Candidatus Pacearchaeota archaeon]|nr:hypothetical protein [Candidatus Pacearchaeota archaeon]
MDWFLGLIEEEVWKKTREKYPDEARDVIEGRVVSTLGELARKLAKVAFEE